jgi:hypothetical protein
VAVVITTEGANYYAQVILNIREAADLDVLLFVNDWTPTAEDTTGNYTECTWPGYSLFSLTASEWTGGAAGGVANYSYPLLTFNFDPSGQVQQSIFGYYVVADTGELLYAEKFGAPFPIPPEGGSIPLLLFWTDEQCKE